MDLRYLHRLSRQIRPRPQDAPAAEGHGATSTTSDGTAGLAGVNDTLIDRPHSQARPLDRPPALRRRSSGACEVCGRTLLTGEVASSVDVDGVVLSACPLCVIRIQRAHRHVA